MEFICRRLVSVEATGRLKSSQLVSLRKKYVQTPKLRRAQRSRTYISHGRKQSYGANERSITEITWTQHTAHFSHCILSCEAAVPVCWYAGARWLAGVEWSRNGASASDRCLLCSSYKHIPQTSEIPLEFQDCLDFYVAGKMNMYTALPRDYLVNPIYNRSS